MSPEQIEHLEGLIVKAVQSGKQETSDLVDAVIKKIEPAVQIAVDKSINGKLYKIMDEQKEHKEIVQDYIKEDMKWKESAQPVITMGQNVQGFGKVSLYILGFVASVAGVIIYILNIIKKN